MELTTIDYQSDKDHFILRTSDMKFMISFDKKRKQWVMRVTRLVSNCSRVHPSIEIILSSLSK